MELFRIQYQKSTSKSKSANKGAGGGCGFPGAPACDIDEVIITIPNPQPGSGWNEIPPGTVVSSGECDKYQDCLQNDFLDGGGQNENPTDTTKVPKKPCEQIRNRFSSDTKFQEKYNKLTKTSPASENVFKLDRELATYMRYPTVGTNTAPAFVDIDLPSCATDGNLPSFEEGMGGLMHTHNDESCTGGTPIRVPSPTDIQTFLNVLMREAMQYTGSYANAYSLIATSGGNYMLMYSGTNYPGSINYNQWEKLNEDYKDVFQYLYSRNENVRQADVEKVFTKFMKEKINRPGLEIYKVTPTSSIKLEYDPNSSNSVKLTPCP